jgi:hypothetical protein
VGRSRCQALALGPRRRRWPVIAPLESRTGSLGAVHYDELDPKAQAERRQVWSDGIDRRIEGLDLRSELEASGVPYSSLDQNGNVVTHYPGDNERS